MANGPIQVIPPGLLGYLQIKNFGQNPTELVNTVQPNIDLWRQYLLANQETLLSSNIAVNAVGGFGSLVNAPISPVTGSIALEGQVPQREVWAVHHFSVSMNGVLGAGQDASIMTMIEYGLTGGGGGIGVATGQASRVFTVGEGPHATSDIPGGFLLMPPVSQLYVWCSRLTAGPINVNVRARFTRLPT